MKRSGAPNVTDGIEEWLVVLRADGVVDAVEGGAPATWLGRNLADTPEASGVLRQAVDELVRSPPTSMVRRRKVSCSEGDLRVEVELLLVEALPIRRVFTRVHDLAMRTLDLFMLQAKSSDIDLTFDLEEGIPPAVFVDSEKIAWAISTLVANGLRYAKKHVGVRVRWEKTSNDVLVEVYDDGVGVPEAQVRWLFERNPATGRAAGLALLMVSDVVAAHRGAVAVESTPGQGSKFTLRIPRVVPAPFPAR